MTSTVLCLMAKAPVPGRVKTRMVPPLTPEAAARLAEAFLLDTWTSATSVPDLVAHLAYAGDLADFPARLHAVPSFPQPNDPDLGARIEAVARAGLGFAERVLVIGSDLPGLPPAHLAAARAALTDHDAVLGPSADGGYYLIGLGRCEPGLLADLPWSSPQTYAATRDRLLERGYRVAAAPPFDDLDDLDDLRTHALRLRRGDLDAPATARVLEELAL